MTKKTRIIISAIALVTVVLFVIRVQQARRDLVTLDVVNMPLRKVIRKIEWQTWESIDVQKNLEASITLNVKRVPLTEVLEILAEQSEARWTLFYPLYTAKKSYNELRQIVRGEKSQSDSVWKSFNARGSFGFGGAGSEFAENLGVSDGTLSLTLKDQTVESGLRSISRLSNAKVVAEDGTSGKITLNVVQTPLKKAVALVAKQLHRSHSHFYALLGGGRPPEVALVPRTSEANSEERPAGDRSRGSEGGRGNIMQRLEEFQQLSAADQQKKLNDLGVPAEFQSSLQQLAQMPAEQRGDFIQQQIQSPQIQGRIQDRMLKSLTFTTPEQRAARDRRTPQRMGQNRP